MKYIYHYRATWREPNIAGTEWSIDGILTMVSGPVTTMDEYQMVKEQIMNEHLPGKANRHYPATRLCIHSLSLLHTVDA